MEDFLGHPPVGETRARTLALLFPTDKKGNRFSKFDLSVGDGTEYGHGVVLQKAKEQEGDDFARQMMDYACCEIFIDEYGSRMLYYEDCSREEYLVSGKENDQWLSDLMNRYKIEKFLFRRFDNEKEQEVEVVIENGAHRIEHWFSREQMKDLRFRDRVEDLIRETARNQGIIKDHPLKNTEEDIRNFRSFRLRALASFRQKQQFGEAETLDEIAKEYRAEK